MSTPIHQTPLFAPIPGSLSDAVPFVGPETLERQRGAVFRARLGANENGFGPSPRAVQAMAEAASEVWKYGDPTSHDLRADLALALDVTPDHLVVGEGIDGLLGLIVRLMVAPGDRVVTSVGGYPTFDFHVNGFGGVMERVPYLGDRQDVQGLIRRGRETGARLIYVCNPDNPMGGWLPPEEIEAALADLADDTILILDEAYAEFAPALPRINADDPRIIRMRTFSKAYGMAGARVGYAIGAPDVIRAFGRIRNHFGVNLMGQRGAQAALADRDWLAQTVRNVFASRARIAEIAARNGVVALPSATNFVAVDLGRDADHSRRVLVELAEDGVFARMPWVAPHTRCIRISCGPDAEMDVLAEALPGALARAGAAADA